MRKVYYRERATIDCSWGEWKEIDDLPKEMDWKGWYQNSLINGSGYFISNANIDVERCTKQYMVDYKN